MKPPLIVQSVRSPEDVLVFSSVDGAERYLEPIDVLGEEYIAYDSEGRRLRLTAPNAVDRITIGLAELAPRHSDELRATLIRLLSCSGKEVDDLQQMTLPDLVQRACRYARV